MPASASKTRAPDERVSYGLAHYVRIEILCLLNQGTYSPMDLAERLKEQIGVISYHVKELLNAGCIELADTRKKRNADQHFYRAIKLPLISDEEAALLSPDERKKIAGVILQGIMAEGLDALRAGKLSDDPSQVRMFWSWFSLDDEGRAEMAREQRESWDRMCAIEARAANRRAKSDTQVSTTEIAAILGFPRNRAVGAAPGKRFLPAEEDPE